MIGDGSVSHIKCKTKNRTYKQYVRFFVVYIQEMKHIIRSKKEIKNLLRIYKVYMINWENII